MSQGGPRKVPISLQGGLQICPISLRGGVTTWPPRYCGVVNIFHPSPFYRSTPPPKFKKKNHCRIPLEKWNCMVEGGLTCPSEIAAGWSDIFPDITAGYPKKKNCGRVVWKVDARHPPTNFSNGITLIYWCINLTHLILSVELFKWKPNMHIKEPSDILWCKSRFPQKYMMF